jgi:hypothetical protein
MQVSMEWVPRCCNGKMKRKGWLPIGFASRKLKGAEPRYTTTERENLAVVFGLRKFRHHLYGEKFEVITDHIALTWLLALRDPKERLDCRNADF